MFTLTLQFLVLELEMEADQENDEFEDAKLIEDAVFYLREKTYRVDCTKNWKRSVRRKAEKFETRDGEILYRKKDGGVVGKCFICGIMHVRVVCTGMITCNSTLVILDWFILFLGEIRR